MFNILHDKVYNSGILRDKTIKDKLMYVHNNRNKIKSFCRFETNKSKFNKSTKKV